MGKVVLLLSVLMLWEFSSGQSNPYPEVSISSPTAAALGKYGDIPVSYHTGIPEISIPIYTVSEGPLKLPVSLSYHAGGIKLLETASWVGLGWSLNAGGVITRNVQGAPDEKGTSNTSSQTWGHFSDYGYNNYLYVGQNGQTSTSNIQDWQNFANGIKDGQPDLFFFNFNGYSGKFYFADDRTPVIVPQQDFKIEETYTPGASIQSFTITTPDGVKYIFGNSPGVSGAAPIESTNPWNLQSGSTPGTVISSWFLNKIQTADGLFSINLQYTSETFGFFTIGTHPIDPTNPYGPNSQNDPGYYLTKNIVSGVRLSKISFSNGEIDFVANTVRTDLSNTSLSATDGVNTTAKSLDQVQIKDNNNNCRQFNFSYDYFTDATTPLPTVFSLLYSNVSTDAKRLRLKSVQESDCNSTTPIPPYTFSYSSYNLPRRLCFAQDFWGYNNGVTGNSSLIPTCIVTNGTQNNTWGNANRSTVMPAMQAGNLEKITYPTGGSTLFEYEANDVITNAQNYGYQDNSTLWVHLPGAESIRSETNTITINDASHSVHIYINNTSDFSSTLAIKNLATGTIVQTYTVGNNTVDNEDVYLSAGNYDVTLTVSADANLTGGCQSIIYYNWGYVPVKQNTQVGGLRIKTITESEGITSNKNVVTNYSYYDHSNFSTAALYDLPAFTQIVRNDIIQYTGYWSPAYGFTPNISYSGCVTYPGARYYVSAGNLRPMSTFQGGNVGYYMVTVSQTGNGSSIYHFHINDNDIEGPQTYTQVATTNVDASFCHGDAPNYPAAPLPYIANRGELYYEEYFDNSGFKLKDKFYYPVFDIVPTLSTPVFIGTSFYNGSGWQLLGTFDSARTYKKESMKIVETDYSRDGNSITMQNTKYSDSKYHNQVTKEQTTDSKGNLIENDYKYAFDFRVTSCDISNCFTNYASSCTACQNTYNTAINACVYQNDQQYGQCLTNAHLTLLQCQNNTRFNYISCQKTNYNTSISCHNSAKSSADTNLNPILEMQDQYINAAIETSEWRSNQLIAASFNKYLKATSGAIYYHYLQKLNLSAPSATFTNAIVNSSGLTKDSRYADEAVVNYRSGNIHDLTDKAGVTNAYIWDYSNNMPVAKIIGAFPTDTIAYSSFEADGKGNWNNYAGTVTTVAVAPFPPTGTKYYNLTATNTLNKTVISGHKYIVSYWSKNGSYTITGGTGSITTGVSINGWTFYQHTVLASSTTLNISGTGAIDEVRLYPAYARMTTYTYSPLVGMTSQCDVNNVVTYYTYDGLGRLYLVKDQNGNVLKKYCYSYNGQSAACALP